MTPGVETVDDSFYFNAHTIALYNDLSIIYKINATQLEGCTDPYIIATINNKPYRIDGVRTSSDGKDRYWFELKNVLPQHAATTVYTVLFATDSNGQLVKTVIDEYSIRQYCKNILNNATYSTDAWAKLRTLLVDLVNYCAEAQQYPGKEYRTNDLCNNFITEEMKPMGTQEVPELIDRKVVAGLDNNTAPVKIKGVTLRLDQSVSIRYTVEADSIEGLIPVFTNSSGKKSTAYFVENTETEATNDYFLYYSGYNFSQMDNPVTLTIYNSDGEAVSSTLTYSINSYIYSVLYVTHNPPYSDAVKSIAAALAKLGASAKAYIG